ncbi:hypothetical protein ACH5RR_004694 [Cinchona calisaya]|uniref:Uncharacterized protein n=1 Tax=Cinchona calisaya TaxID=153742 RepID=A0ABD3AYP2_9GENT
MAAVNAATAAASSVAFSPHYFLLSVLRIQSHSPLITCSSSLVPSESRRYSLFARSNKRPLFAPQFAVNKKISEAIDGAVEDKEDQMEEDASTETFLVLIYSFALAIFCCSSWW